jgi:hypothetical protein
MSREDAVSDVHRSAREPGAVDIPIDPSDDGAVDDDARGGLWVGRTRPEPASPFRVASREERVAILELERAERDDPIAGLPRGSEGQLLTSQVPPDARSAPRSPGPFSLASIS